MKLPASLNTPCVHPRHDDIGQQQMDFFLKALGYFQGLPDFFFGITG
jgi:hypothetical protein